jgi:hypothetical protein
MAKISQLAAFNFFLCSQPKTIEMFLRGAHDVKSATSTKNDHKSHYQSDDNKYEPNRGKQ